MSNHKMSAPDPKGHQARINARIWKILELAGGLLQLKLTLFKGDQSQKFTAGMVQAASHGNLSLLKQFVKWGADLNAPDPTNKWHPTALYEAAKAGHLETVKFILAQGVDANAMSGRWGCALAAAAHQGRMEVLECLLNQGADLNAYHILHHGVDGGLEIVELLINKGVNLQILGEGALEMASKDGKFDIVKLLIEKGVNPMRTLQRACYYGRLEVVRILVENGADVNAQCREWEWGTALRAAIDGEEQEVVQFLIDSGADVNVAGGGLSPPLQLAIENGCKEIQDILRIHGARE
ncbi:ankyrin repeat-containing domain protein [Mycena floridula]|nr:ankyrin repeat-containing domain protein [Mycena floridula]